MYTTLGAPSGALGGSKGAQSGTESLMPTLMVPSNALLIGFSSAFSVPVLVAAPGRVTRSAAEQLGLAGGELLVTQRALLMQVVELVELIEHGRSLRRGRLGWRWRWLLVLRRGRLLLLKVRDALVLIGLRVRLLFPLPAPAPADRVCGTADRGRTQQWASSPQH